MAPPTFAISLPNLTNLETPSQTHQEVCFLGDETTQLIPSLNHHRCQFRSHWLCHLGKVSHPLSPTLLDSHTGTKLLEFGTKFKPNKWQQDFVPLLALKILIDSGTLTAASGQETRCCCLSLFFFWSANQLPNHGKETYY